MKGAKTCNLESYEHCVLGKKMKVKGIIFHCAEGVIDLVHMNVWGLSHLASQNTEYGDVMMAADTHEEGNLFREYLRLSTTSRIAHTHIYIQPSVGMKTHI